MKCDLPDPKKPDIQIPTLPDTSSWLGESIADKNASKKSLK